MTDGDDVRTITLSPGEMTTRNLYPGTYTITAESADDRTVKLAGRERLTIAVGKDPESRTATRDERILSLENRTTTTSRSRFAKTTTTS